MASDPLFLLSACDAAERLARGEITSLALVESYLARIEEIDGDVQAWAFIDPELAREQARAADMHRQAGGPLGPLHGLPIALKDIVDTAWMPCENGTLLDAGRQPQTDATVVSLLREAGAILLGKTVTTELAFYHPGKTRNPHDARRTPGGSSSGSAAAVAMHMAPLAIGSQTNGSMIRPASFCGVTGFKPTFGLISRHGVLKLAPSLDTLGVFANSVEDCALLGDALMRFDAQDEAMVPREGPHLLEISRSEPPVTPKIAFVKSPVWERTEEPTRAGFSELVAALGEACEEIELPSVFDNSLEWHRALMHAEMARHLGPYARRGREQMSDVLLGVLDDGAEVSAVAYQEALDGQDILNAGLDAIFDRFDAIITPAAAGEAPSGLGATGDPSFCTIWTYCAVPAVALPLMEGTNGLPVGVQLIGRRHDDARLLRTARWLTDQVMVSA
jgi:Asp-tRNA(Asn)/Glu-tRNA(Gln) amidotransferase A subunit family amidase